MVFAVYAINLAATALVEGALVWLLFRCGRYVYYSLLANLLTNPALNLLLQLGVAWLGARSYWPLLAALELMAVFAEAVVYKSLCGFLFKKALGSSLLLNACSFGAGLLLWHFLTPLFAA